MKRFQNGPKNTNSLIRLKRYIFKEFFQSSINLEKGGYIKNYLNNRELITRFWYKVDIKYPDSCWNWTAGTQSKGYGSFGIGNGKTALAHRVAFELEYGEIPEGLCVMHGCDNRKCCNTNHLSLGTIADNNRDMVEKPQECKTVCLSSLIIILFQ